jgi:hypothetical protein
VFEKEKSLNEFKEYRQNALASAADQILPELLDLVQGTNIEELNRSIEDAINRTQSILGNVRSVTSAGPQPGFQGSFNPSGVPRGSAVTAPSMGPLDEGPGNIRSLTADDIAKMSPDEYARHRDQIMGELSRQVQARGGSPYQ